MLCFCLFHFSLKQFSVPKVLFVIVIFIGGFFLILKLPFFSCIEKQKVWAISQVPVVHFNFLLVIKISHAKVVLVVFFFK